MGFFNTRHSKIPVNGYKFFLMTHFDQTFSHGIHKLKNGLTYTDLANQWKKMPIELQHEWEYSARVHSSQIKQRSV